MQPSIGRRKPERLASYLYTILQIYDVFWSFWGRTLVHRDELLDAVWQAGFAIQSANSPRSM
ncbi:hypothetical protein Alches_24600 [Alicyclobacillus hesperidum subsp. aegles]|nr:hypothetical protein Alches_24600 [Alicyclobacillus hesperidum subsp. aegles]